MTAKEWIHERLASTEAKVNVPRAVVVIGGPASGKTRLLRSMGNLPNGMEVVDSDEEPYAVDRADALARSRERMYRAIHARRPLWIGGASCDPGKAMLVLAGLLTASYHVIQVQLDVGLDVALARNHARTLAGESRVVPADLFWRAHKHLIPSLAFLTTLSHVYARFDSEDRMVGDGRIAAPDGVGYLRLAEAFVAAAGAIL